MKEHFYNYRYTVINNQTNSIEFLLIHKVTNNNLYWVRNDSVTSYINTVVDFN